MPASTPILERPGDNVKEYGVYEAERTPSPLSSTPPDPQLQVASPRTPDFTFLSYNFIITFLSFSGEGRRPQTQKASSFQHRGLTPAASLHQQAADLFLGGGPL